MYDVNSSNLLWIHFDRPGYKTVKHITKKIVIKNQNNLRNPIKYSIFMNLSKKDDIKDLIPV